MNDADGSMLPRDAAADLVLASASPRRADLLRAAGFRFAVAVADVDETQRTGEPPDAYVERLALAKARAIAASGELRTILGADTTVVVDGETLTKPDDAADALRMLSLLSGRTHQVLTGIAIIERAVTAEPPTTRRTLTAVSTTAVTFATLSASEQEWYVSSGEPMGKAGGYAIQGLASRFVRRIEGSYANVVGLPVAEVWAMCRQLGILLS